MKNSIVASFIFLCLFTFADAQTAAPGAQKTVSAALTAEQTESLAEITEYNKQLIDFYGQKKYDEALAVGLKEIAVAEKNNLADDLRFLPILTNVGEVYLVKSRESDAVAVFQRVLDAYRKNLGETNLPVARTNERIGAAFFNKPDLAKAETYLLRAAELRERLNASQTREAAGLFTALAAVYRQRRNMEKAGEYYLRAIGVNDQVLNRDEQEKRTDIIGYECFLYHKALAEDKLKDVSEQIKAFGESRKKPADKIIDSGIINGQAISLPKPKYPDGARGLSGFVLVRVTIDEQGDVEEAKATCGITEFVRGAEGSARKSKFTPTILKGERVKVTGIIVYNFVK